MPISLLLSVLLVSGLVAEAPRFRCETLAGAWIEGELLGLQADGLRVGTATGRVVSPAIVVEALGRPPIPVAAAGPQDLLVLAPRGPGLAGDRLTGHLVGGDDAGVVWQLPSGESLELPFEVIDRLLPAVDRPLDRLLDLRPEGLDDRLWRRRTDGALDAVAGVIAEVDGEGLVMETALGDLRFAWADVLAAVLSGTEHPGTPLAGHPVRIALNDGSVFEAGLLAISQGQLEVDTAFRRGWRLPLSSLASMVLSDRADAAPLWLADLQPEDVREGSSLAGGDDTTLFPWRRGLAVAGTPLVCDGLARATGWGAHADCELSVRVPEGARWLRVTAGLSDDVLALPASGSIDVALLLDGRVAAGPVRVVEGQPPVVLRLADLVPGQRLALRVTDGGDHDAGDRAVWVDGLFGRDDG